MVTDVDIITDKKCPYCGQASVYTDSICVYKKQSYGMIYLCEPCDAYVGVHKGTDQALGRLANGLLRFWKKQAHTYFDNLWEQKMSKGFSKTQARHAAYKWLSDSMGIDHDHTHIGMFDVEECKRVVELCKPFKK